MDKSITNISISDPDLGINALVNGDGVLAAGETIVVTSTVTGFEYLDQPGRCDIPGLKINKATMTAEVPPPDDP
ncbi:MAG: hypothetical protein WBN51_05210, partial [Gammaproteobacteria bacterium]